jgi:hypothetical protein
VDAKTVLEVVDDKLYSNDLTSKFVSACRNSFVPGLIGWFAVRCSRQVGCPFEEVDIHCRRQGWIRAWSGLLRYPRPPVYVSNVTSNAEWTSQITSTDDSLKVTLVPARDRMKFLYVLVRDSILCGYIMPKETNTRLLPEQEKQQPT